MKYFVIKEKLINEDDVEYAAYGIECRERGFVLQRFSDISLSYWEIKKLCRKCNKLKADIVHMGDIVEDFLVK